MLNLLQQFVVYADVYICANENLQANDGTIFSITARGKAKTPYRFTGIGAIIK
jgi:hypothetical protein